MKELHSNLTNLVSRRHLILKLENIDLSIAHKGCIPGVFVGTVIGGIPEGKLASVALRCPASDENAEQAGDLADLRQHCQAVPGGYIAFEQVNCCGCYHTAAIAVQIGGPDSELHVRVPVCIRPSLASPTGFGNANFPSHAGHMAQIMHADAMETCQSFDALIAALRFAFATREGAFVAITYKVEGEKRQMRTSFARSSGYSGTPREATDAFLVSIGRDFLYAAFRKRARVDVAPLEALALGQPARPGMSKDHGAIEPEAFETGGRAGRIAEALAKFNEDETSLVASRFPAQADPEAAESFRIGGWKNLTDSDVVTFFARYGLILPATEPFGFARSVVAVGNSVDGSGIRVPYLSSVRALARPIPLNAVPTRSDPLSAKRYFRAFKYAIKNVLRMRQLRK